MKKIIVVDDDKHLRRLIRNVVEKELGIPVVSLNPTCSENFEFIKENKFELLILDYMMPKYDGLEFLLNLEEVDVNIPTIIVTAYPDVEQVKSILETRKQKTELLQKPFEINELLKLVKEMLN